MTFHGKTSVPTDSWLAFMKERVTHHAASVFVSSVMLRHEPYVTHRLKLDQELDEKGQQLFNVIHTS